MEGMVSKPPLWQVLKGDRISLKLYLRFRLCALLQPCVQMDLDADNHSEEGIALFGVYAHTMKMIIIQNPVIHPLAGSAVIVCFLVFCRPSWNGSVKADVPVWFCVDTAAIRRGRAFFLTGTGTHFAAGQRAAPFTGMLLSTVPPVDHAQASHAQGSAVLINGNGAGDGVRPPPVGVEVNKRMDFPFLTEAVGSIVVMCGVQAEIPDRDIRVKGPEFPEGDNGAYAVMPPGVQETDMQRQVDTVLCIMGAEQVKGVSEIKDFLITVPAPVCIRV